MPFQLHKFIQKIETFGVFWYLKTSYEDLDTSVQVPKEFKKLLVEVLFLSDKWVWHILTA